MRRGDANAAAASRVLAATHLEVPSYAQAYEPPSPALREAQGRLRDLERRRGRCLTSCACRLAEDPPPAAAPPLVSVVCATMGSRAAFHGLLLECFRRQTWPAKELVVYDTGGAPSPTLRDAGDARYVHAPTHVSLGAKRRLLLGLARGTVVAHFDDDNVYGPDYLATMVPHCAAAELGARPATRNVAQKTRRSAGGGADLVSLSGWTNYRVCEGPASSRLMRSSSVSFGRLRHARARRLQSRDGPRGDLRPRRERRRALPAARPRRGRLRGPARLPRRRRRRGPLPPRGARREHGARARRPARGRRGPRGGDGRAPRGRRAEPPACAPGRAAA